MATFVKAPCDEGVIRSAPDTAPSPAHVGLWVLVATILGSSMALLDGSVVNVALPVIQRDFNTTATNIQWVVEAYSLFLAALLLVGGTLGDRFGRRRIFSSGIVVFILASIACGFSPTVLFLILARAVERLAPGRGLLRSPPYWARCLGAGWSSMPPGAGFSFSTFHWRPLRSSCCSGACRRAAMKMRPEGWIGGAPCWKRLG